MSPRTRWVILNSPSNPSGAVFSADDLRMIGDVVAPYERALVLSDEIYESIIFTGSQFTSFAAACPDLRDRTLTVNGLAKSHAMTGWRIGYGAGPAGLIATMTKLTSQSTTAACTISQAAAVEALLGDQTFVTTSCKRYEERRDLLTGLLERAPPHKPGLAGVLEGLVPEHFVGALARGEVLPVLVFAVLFGAALASVGIGNCLIFRQCFFQFVGFKQR